MFAPNCMVYRIYDSFCFNSLRIVILVIRAHSHSWPHKAIMLLFEVFRATTHMLNNTALKKLYLNLHKISYQV